MPFSGTLKPRQISDWVAGIADSCSEKLTRSA